MSKQKIEKEALPVTDKNEIVMYQPEGAEFHIAVRVENETVWLTQAQMAELFCKNQSVIARHIQNAFKEGEVTAESNMHILHNTLSKYKPTTIYSLDVIISVGYRVKSTNGVKFRRWANQVLRDYLLKGYAVNQRMLAPLAQQKQIENVDSRLTVVERQVDFFVNTVHSAQNQKIEQLSNDVQKVMENFIDPTTYKHFLFFDGQKLEADVAYMKIYGIAKKSITIIDNYVGVKTLDLLRGIAKGVSVTIYSEEWGDEKITPAIKADFEKARPDVSLNIDCPNRKFHDRYIFLDYGLPGEKLFLCGASSKDAGNKVTTIMQIECPEMYRPIIEALKKSSATGVLGGGTP